MPVQIYLPSAEKDLPPVVLKDIRTGEYFGELAIFDDKPRSASVRALVDTVLLELTREELGEHLGRSKTAAMTILAEMAERLRETNAMLSQRAAKDAVKEFEENLTWGQRLADKVAELNGSWAFIIFLLPAQPQLGGREQVARRVAVRSRTPTSSTTWSSPSWSPSRGRSSS